MLPVIIMSMDLCGLFGGEEKSRLIRDFFFLSLPDLLNHFSSLMFIEVQVKMKQIFKSTKYDLSELEGNRGLFYYPPLKNKSKFKNN